MQGIVFTYRRKKREKKPRERRRLNIKPIITKWGAVALFSVCLAAGLAVGCYSAGGLSERSLKSLDFLFTTNLPQRLEGGALNAFFAAFGSDFLFLLCAFLSGLCLWGVAAMPFIAFFKGYGVGVSAGYLLQSFGVKGIFFYITVLLPGIVMFSMALVYQLDGAFGIFRGMLAALFSKQAEFRPSLAGYLKRGLKYLVITFSASLLDMILWTCLSGLFF